MITNKKICFIANNANGRPISDGQHAKVRTWLEMFELEKALIDFVELDGWKKKPISVMTSIKKGIKNCDIILLMCAVNGARTLIPFINKINKKLKKKFIYSFIGSGPLSNILNKMNANDAVDFLVNCNFGNASDKKMAKQLAKVDVLLTETQIIQKTISQFYKVTNVHTINNFRLLPEAKYQPKTFEKPIKLVFLSRVCKEKGIFDLLKAFTNLTNNLDYSLTIYGPFQLTKSEKQEFDKYIEQPNILYGGIIEPTKVIEVLKRFDVFCFPTKYLTESVPGVIPESFFSGLPVLSSAFPQSSSIVSDGFDSLVYKFGDVNDLEDKLCLLTDKRLLEKLSKNACSSSKKFSYKFIIDELKQYFL